MRDRPIAAVVLDLDGTLVDSQARFARAYQAALTVYGFASAGDAEFLRRQAEGVLLSSLELPQADWPEFWRVLMVAFVSERDPSEAFPGAVEAIRALAERGLGLAVVTGRGCPASEVEDELDASGFEGLFDHVLSSGAPDQLQYSTSGAQTKRTLFREACELLGHEPAECAYATDWPADLEDAGQFGFTPLVGVTTSGYPAAAFVGADRVLSSVADLPDTLR
jgi:phosphoglycolate phosphatase-like HAD superfamily hydrolase